MVPYFVVSLRLRLAGCLIPSHWSALSFMYTWLGHCCLLASLPDSSDSSQGKCKAYANVSHRTSRLDLSVFQQCAGLPLFLGSLGSLLVPILPASLSLATPTPENKTLLQSFQKAGFALHVLPQQDSFVLSCILSLSQLLALITLYCNYFLLYILPKPEAFCENRLDLYL